METHTDMNGHLIALWEYLGNEWKANIVYCHCIALPMSVRSVLTPLQRNLNGVEPWHQPTWCVMIMKPWQLQDAKPWEPEKQQVNRTKP